MEKRACTDCGGEPDNGRGKTLCASCRSMCAECGGPRSPRRHWRICEGCVPGYIGRERKRNEAVRVERRRTKLSCKECGGSGGALCASCRAKCRVCGGGRDLLSQRLCRPCRAAVERKKYEGRRARPTPIMRAVLCWECGDDLKPADGHFVVAATTRFCSDVCRWRNNARRRRTLRMGSEHEPYRAADVFLRDGWVCQLCEEPIDKAAAPKSPMSPCLDHVLPLSMRGRDAFDNVQAAHWFCNSRKGNRVADADVLERRWAA